MLTVILAVLAAAANALSWVLQRKANREIPASESLSLRLIADLLRKPVWFGGIAAITAGFVLQAAALGTGALALVEPILIIELPLTLLLGSYLFHSPLSSREWVPIIAMTIGLSALLLLLSPSAGSGSASWYQWLIGIGINAALLAGLVAWSKEGMWRPAWLVRLAGPHSALAVPPRGTPPAGRVSGSERAALLGVAAGAAFGLTAALMKGMTGTFHGRLVNIFGHWQIYAMVGAGVLGFFLTQSALNAGRLVAAQPGISIMDPLVSVAWGIVVFGEQVRGGLLIIPEAISVILIAAAAVALARSPLLAEH
ncbi:MAG TPA: DMT family transporter [Streptosporangiaceae bacterium]|nr:DMT family transporter [Streptosporangiaceae bacterium]